MVDTYTPNYNWTLPEAGASVDTWGGKVNANFASLDGILFGKAAKGDNRDITSLGNLTGPVIAPYFLSTGSGALGSFESRTTRYGAAWRNDDTSFWLAVTNQGDPAGGIGPRRPFLYSLVDGFVTIDGTGAGTGFGGNIVTPANIQANTLSVNSTGYFGGYFQANSTMRVGDRAFLQNGFDANGTKSNAFGGLYVRNAFQADNGFLSTEDLRTYRSANAGTGFVYFGADNRGYVGHDGTNSVIGGNGALYAQQGRVWGSNDFNINTKVNRDSILTVGWNSGNPDRPYMADAGTYTGLVRALGDYTRMGTENRGGYGTISFLSHYNGSDPVYTPRLVSGNYFAISWNGNDIINQVDGTGFTMQIVGRSDLRLKNVEGALDSEEAESVINRLNPVAYEFKQDLALMGVLPGRRLGFIAQELEAISPNLVLKGPREEDIMLLSQDAAMQIVAVLVKQVQTLTDRVMQLEKEVYGL